MALLVPLSERPVNDSDRYEISKSEERGKLSINWPTKHSTYFSKSEQWVRIQVEV